MVYLFCLWGMFIFNIRLIVYSFNLNIFWFRSWMDYNNGLQSNNLKWWKRCSVWEGLTALCNIYYVGNIIYKNLTWSLYGCLWYFGETITNYSTIKSELGINTEINNTYRSSLMFQVNLISKYHITAAQRSGPM